MRSVRSSPGLWWGLADSDLWSVNVSADVRIVLSTGCQRKKDGRKAKCLQGRKDHQDFSEAQWEQDHPQSCDKVKGQQAHHPVLCFSLHLHLQTAWDHPGRVNGVFVQGWLERSKKQQDFATLEFWASDCLTSLPFVFFSDTPWASWQTRYVTPFFVCSSVSWNRDCSGMRQPCLSGILLMVCSLLHSFSVAYCGKGWPWIYPLHDLEGCSNNITSFFHWLCWVEVPRVTVPVPWEAVGDNERCHPTGWKLRVQKSPERPEKIQAGERNGISAIFLISNLFCQMISLPLLRSTFTAAFSWSSYL